MFPLYGHSSQSITIRGSSVSISVNCNHVISIVSQTTGFFNRAILWQSELMQCKSYFSDLCYLISMICKLHWLLSSWISLWFIGLVAGLGLGTLAEVAKRQLGLGKTGTYYKNLVNPYTLKCDHKEISPHNIMTTSSRKVMRI